METLRKKENTERYPILSKPIPLNGDGNFFNKATASRKPRPFQTYSPQRGWKPVVIALSSG